MESAIRAGQMPPMIRTGTELRAAIQHGEQMGARLMAGSVLSATERRIVGGLLYQLAGVSRRAFDPDTFPPVAR